MTPRIINARNVNDALSAGLWHLRTSGIRRDSRNGPVIVAPGPVLTVYRCPWERLVMDPRRDANHVFHLMETIWMLAGQRNVGWLLSFNSNFAQYADGGIQHGAYGWRWASLDPHAHQLVRAVEELRKPDNRRVVVQMWDAEHDLGSPAKDVPCNTQIYFQVIDSKLEMTVCCRSNDIIWGAYGANAVHFSFLQQIMAEELGVDMGAYCQFSNNYHLYPEMGQGKLLYDNPPADDYGYPHLTRSILGGQTLQGFLGECGRFVRGEFDHITNLFLLDIALPLMRAYLERKMGGDWRRYASECPSCDWKDAFLAWAARRDNKEQA